MNKSKSILMLLLAVAMLAMTCAAGASDELPYAEGTVLRMATGYNSAKTGLFFDAETAGEGITLADGITYHSGDLKPTWVEVEKELGIVIENKYQGNGASAEFDYWKEQLDQVDILSGTASKLSEYGESGAIVNIAEYIRCRTSRLIWMPTRLSAFPSPVMLTPARSTSAPTSMV